MEQDSSTKSRVKLAVQLLLGALVVWGAWRTAQRASDDLHRQRQRLEQQLAELEEQIQQADRQQQPQRAEQLRAERRQLQRQRLSVRNVSPWHLAAAGGAYLLGLLPCWFFWHRALGALQQTPSPYQSLRAYVIGHLGKYVPGKALVVVLRAGLLRAARVDTAAAALAVFVETLTTMAAGAFLSAAYLAWHSTSPLLLLIAVGLMLCAAVPTYPPLFRRIVRALKVRRASPQIESLLAGLDLPLMAQGWLVTTASWFGLGASLWLVLQALPGVAPQPQQLPLLTASVALATVAGFLSLIPGGLVVREWVVTVMLAPVYGEAASLSAAIVLRVVWLVSETLLSAILYVLPQRRDASSDASADSIAGARQDS